MHHIYSCRIPCIVLCFGVWVSSSGSIFGFHLFSYRLQCPDYPIFRLCFLNSFAFSYCMMHTPDRAGRVRELSELNGGTWHGSPNWTEQTFQTNWCLVNWTVLNWCHTGLNFEQEDFVGQPGQSVAGNIFASTNFRPL